VDFLREVSVYFYFYSLFGLCFVAISELEKKWQILPFCRGCK